jgi:hypothetical protein
MGVSEFESVIETVILSSSLATARTVMFLRCRRSSGECPMVSLEVLDRMLTLRNDGRSCREIAEALNLSLIPYRPGKDWTDDAVWYVLYRSTKTVAPRLSKGNRPFGSTRTEKEVMALIVDLRAKGLELKQIARVLNEKGHMTRKGTRWTVGRIHSVLGRHYQGIHTDE